MSPGGCVSSAAAAACALNRATASAACTASRAGSGGPASLRVPPMGQPPVHPPAASRFCPCGGLWGLGFGVP